jgi:membrane-bound serine protease (ClpP class)
MKRIGLLLLFFAFLGMAFQPARAQSDEPLAIVMTADGPIMPPMLEYINRGIEVADRRGAEVLIVQLDTPGGSVDTMKEIINTIRSSPVPVVVYVAPRGSWAISAGALVTMAGHASAMAPETTIGAVIPINSSGENLTSDLRTKEMNALKDKIHPFVEPRGDAAVELAEAMIEEGKTATAKEALEAHLVDFVVDNIDDLLEALDGFTVQMSDGPHTLHTTSARTEPLEMTFIEQLLLFLTDPNIVFTLLSVGTMAILIEISSPGGWVAGFIGIICVTVALYGIGLLSVNWFGVIFLAIAFVLFLLDIKAATHGALTTAGVASFIVGALVLFNSPGTPQFQRVSVPLVVGTGISIGLLFMAAVMFALRALNLPVRAGVESFVGKTGIARTAFEPGGGQVQVGSELWSAESTEDSSSIGKGDRVEVVEVKGLRLKVRKVK